MELLAVARMKIAVFDPALELLFEIFQELLPRSHEGMITGNRMNVWPRDSEKRRNHKRRGRLDLLFQHDLRLANGNEFFCSKPARHNHAVFVLAAVSVI